MHKTARLVATDCI